MDLRRDRLKLSLLANGPFQLRQEVDNERIASEFLALLNVRTIIS